MTEHKYISDKIGRLFKKYGFRSITMDEVARELGMSKKTLYQIVPDKSNLVEMVLTDEFNKYETRVIEIQNLDSDAIDGFIRLNELLYEFLLDFSPITTHDLEKFEPEFYERIKSKYVEIFLNAIRNNLIKGKKEKLYRNELDIEVISKLHLARIEQIPNSKIFSKEEFTSHEFVKEICLYHLHGVLNKTGMNQIEKYEHELDNILKRKHNEAI